MFICIYVCMYVCMYVHIYKNLYMYMYIYICIHIHIHIYSYVYIDYKAKQPMNVAAFQRALDVIQGTHDFRAFGNRLDAR
jgi:tRNA U38,U39,U40 pseudouridine synthase TruA